MIYNKNNLAVAKIASKQSSGQPELEGVFFKKDRTVATDGYRLLEITTPADMKIEDYPDGFSAMRGFKPFIARADMLKDIKLSDKNAIPIFNTMAVKHIYDNRIEFITPFNDIADIKVIARINANYPDYEQIFPKEAPKAEISVNAEYLIELLQVLGKLDNHYHEVKIRFYGEDKPLLMNAGNDYGQKGRAMLMAVKTT